MSINQEYSQSILLLWEELNKQFQDFKIMDAEFLFDLTLKADIEKAPENLKMGLINAQCNTDLCQKHSETKLQTFYYYLPKESSLYWDPPGQHRQHFCVWTIIFSYEQ